jgi:hypothetical protein
MKKFLCILLMCLLVSTSAVYAVWNPILIMAELPGGPVKAPIPVKAGQDDGEVQIFFMADIGLVDICIKNPQGAIIYHDIVDSDVMPDVVIDTTSWSSGDYALILMLENGIRLNGEFSL